MQSDNMTPDLHAEKHDVTRRRGILVFSMRDTKKHGRPTLTRGFNDDRADSWGPETISWRLTLPRGIPDFQHLRFDVLPVFTCEVIT